MITNKIRIHLADDHQALIDGLTNLLQTVPNFEVVGNSLSGTTFYNDVLQNNADKLLLFYMTTSTHFYHQQDCI
ncbi:hypothetical protein [Flavobacterium sp. LAR06]|uniref:hypothetical protein n=1 Tax=Flavobacterium sp. LAR06 TaxID=3064897 RepID=UPI0035C2017B